MNLALDIKNNTPYFLPPKKTIREKILSTLLEHKIKGDIEIGIEIVGRTEITNLNKKFRGKDSPTDVLSFPIYRVPPQKPSTPVLLGDIVICYEELATNAQAKSISEENEFINLINHSILHLLGIHHPE